jgi:hypothetical protein
MPFMGVLSVAFVPVIRRIPILYENRAKHAIHLFCVSRDARARRVSPCYKKLINATCLEVLPARRGMRDDVAMPTSVPLIFRPR